MKDIEFISNFINNMQVAFLSTINDKLKVPETRALINLRTNISLKKIFEDKDDILFFTTSILSEKVEQIKKNQSASVYFYNTDSMATLSLFGKVKLIDDKKLKDEIWQEEWKEFYSEGKNDANYGLIEFKIESYKFFDSHHILHEGKI